MHSILTFLVIAIGIIIAENAEITVNLRIEDDKKTIFEGIVSTNGKQVTTTSGGTHRCDGTNNDANSISGHTITSTLHSASKLHGFTWDGFDDYLISRIGNTSQTDSQYWDILLNYNFTEVGGCQQRIKQDDNVLFAFDTYHKVHVLKLEGSHKTIPIGRSIIVTVTDGLTGKPVLGATVENQITNINGRATITLNKLGAQMLKAERSDSVRSNAIAVIVTT